MEGLALLNTREGLSDSEHPIWFCSDSKTPMEKPKDESEATKIPGTTSQGTEQGAGDSHGRT